MSTARDRDYDDEEETSNPPATGHAGPDRRLDRA